MSKIDLTGHRYGHLTVIRKDRDNTWLCLCDCGIEITVPRTDLTYRRIRSCGHKKDLTNRRYGYLTVVNKSSGDNWLCKCDCGREITVSYSNLINKHTISCGNPGHILPNEPDYTGVTFNGFIGIEKVRNSYWLWKCYRCGNVSERKAADVKNGKPCPCQISIDEVDYMGAKYGNLTGVRKVGKNRWLWQCDCGALSVYNVGDVISGKKQSCHGKRSHPRGV